MDSNANLLLAVVRGELQLAHEHVTLDTPIAELGDSLDVYSMLSAVEQAFDVEISNPQSQGLKTLRDLLPLLREASAA